MSARPNPRELAAVFAGGAIGGLIRTALANARPHSAAGWPWVTFAVNLAGAFVLGYAFERLHSQPGDRRVALRFLGPGFCGGLTTFATLELELDQMLRASHYGLAAAYAAASLALGYATVSLATLVARRSEGDTMSALGWVAAVLLAGAASTARFVLEGAVAARAGGRITFGTLAVNLTGTLALGVLAGLDPSHDTALLAGTATLGSYTTFSGWMLESRRLAADGGDRGAAALNVFGSLVLGLGVFVVGRVVGGAL